jgi:uncharacterized protein YdaL
MDKILKYDKSFNALINNYRLEIVPRKYDSIVTIVIRDVFSDTTQTLTSSANVYDSLLNIDLTGFNPIVDYKYEFTVYNQLGDIMWVGGCMYSTKNIQNYQLNNSDENNLKF